MSKMTVLDEAIFEGKDVPVFEVDGKQCWVTGHISDALGYENSKAITRNIRSRWKADFLEGVDFIIIKGRILSDFKVLLEQVSTMDTGRIGHLMLLTRTGVDISGMKCPLPAGVRMRRWLADYAAPVARAVKSGDLSRVISEMSIEDITASMGMSRSQSFSRIAEDGIRQMPLLGCGNNKIKA